MNTYSSIKIKLHPNIPYYVWLPILCQELPTSNVTSLNLGLCRIDDNGVKCLKDILPKSQVTSLNLYANYITDEGAKYFADILSKSHLSHNCISDEGVKYFANALNQSTLTHLNLSLNHIGDEGIAVLIDSLHYNIFLEELVGVYNTEIQDRYNRLKRTKSARK